jgi:hypothetical protein
MFARTAQLAAGERTATTETATGFFDRVRKKLDYDPDQPNSLFRFFGRLINRQSDVNNEAVMTRLIAEDFDKPFSIGGFGRKRNVVLREIKDEKSILGYELRNAADDSLIASHGELMEAFTRFADTMLTYGFNKKVSEELLRAAPSPLGTLVRDTGNIKGAVFLNPIMNRAGGSAPIRPRFLGKIDEILSPKTASQGAKIIEALENDLAFLNELVKAEYIDLDQYQNIAKAFSRIRKFSNVTDFSTQSKMFETSASTVSEGDEFGFEIIRYLFQRNALSQDNSTELLSQVASKIDDLFSRGVITSAQRAESQTAALSTGLNLAAFKTYKYDVGSNDAGNLINTLNRFKEIRSMIRSDGKNLSLLDPFFSGDIAKASRSSINPTGKIASFFKKNLGMGKYIERAVPSALSGRTESNPFTFIPTFATAFNRNPKAAMMSAAGIHTYGNEEGFSLASVPMSVGFQRLNRYFGSVGSGFKESNFYGPLDLYFRGMVGERILPATIIGSAAFTVDRTLGGYTQPKDERGERVYTPLVATTIARGLAEGQALVSGVVPGGMGYLQKRKQLLEGEVPIRKGRFWPLGNTPFRGGKIEYYRPSWYRRLQGGGMFTSDAYGSPIEKFLYYNDFSPLRPLDPYRFERKHYEDRPYPVTGEYFSGPYGAAVPILNATVGRILKPQRIMHPGELRTGLAEYQPVGQSGAYLPTNQYNLPIGLQYGTPVNSENTYITQAAAPVYGRNPVPLRNISPTLSPDLQRRNINSLVNTAIYNENAINASSPQQTGKLAARAQAGYYNSTLTSATLSRTPISRQVLPGVPAGRGISPADIVTAGLPGRTTSRDVIGGEIGYRLQETFGIYGFAGGNIRESLGFGAFDFEPNRSVLQSASKAYGSTRAFWDLNLGGLGDVPLQAEGALGNIEMSEIVRRFIPKERNNIDYLNPIKNRMGKQYGFLPGRDNFIDFTTGDPFTKVKEGELRLPGVGYERFNKLYPDEYGRYGAVNQLDILADVAPYSREYRALESRIDRMGLSDEERAKVGQIRAQVNSIERSRVGFVPYENESALQEITHPIRTIKNKIQHSDNIILNKFIGKRTATEDYERRHVYGSTFPEWQRPIESFIQPIYYKGSQRNPILAASIGAIGFGFFGSTKRSQYILGALGAVSVGSFSTIEKLKEERFIPQERKKQLGLEEYTDILTYVKNRTAASRAEQVGDFESAKQYMNLSKRTMYGADLDSKSIDQLSLAIPKRKRDYFKAMIQAPESERGRILSTAPRLERRIYEAAWGMPVERKPDLVQYFTRHELPDMNWEGWHPNTNMEHVKIKMGQAMGIEMSQMGFFPQQIKEANLINPSYPGFGASNASEKDIRLQLQRLMFDMGINGNITPVTNNSNPDQVNVMAGVR